MSWQQLRAMLWLRWRLSRHQWERGGQINALITLVLVIAGLVLAATGGLAGILVGALALGESEPLVIMLIWDALTCAFLLFWLIGLVTDLQRSEIIDLSRFLHLPVCLRDLFLLNYLSSLLSMSLALLAPAMLGLAAGLALSRGAAHLLLAPLALGFFFMITAWTYCLRGWLASLMVNPRRRRSIIMGVTLGFILLAQVPNLLMQSFMGKPPAAVTSAQSPEQRRAFKQEQEARLERLLVRIHRFVPLLWVPWGAEGLAQHRVGPALAGTAGLLALGVLGLRRAYTSTLAFYRGQTGRTPARRAPSPRPASAKRRLLVAWQLPVLPEEAAAMALATFRSMTRAPEVRMALVVNLFVFGMLGAGVFLRRPTEMPELARPFVASAAVVVTLFGLIQVLFNQFGFDRDGFRSLVLLPAARHHVLLGKNLALAPLALVVFLVLLTLTSVLARLPMAAIGAACLQFVAAFLGLSALGNLTSIFMPYRVSAGSLKPTKTKGTTMLLMMGVNLLVMVTLLPVMLPAGAGLLCETMHWCSSGPILLAGSVLLVLFCGLGYGQSLRPLGACLERREKRILQVVTEEVE